MPPLWPWLPERCQCSEKNQCLRLRRPGPNKWVDPAEVIANLRLYLLQTLVYLRVEGVVLQKVAEERLVVLLHIFVFLVWRPNIVARKVR